MMDELNKYKEAVEVIKSAILESQYDAARTVNEKQLLLYYSVGRYISNNSRQGYWGTGAIDSISGRLGKELPGLRGFSARNLRNMRMFFEEWVQYVDADFNMIESDSNLSDVSAKLEMEEISNWQIHLPICAGLSSEVFCSIGFSQHILILSKVKDYSERIFYIKLCAGEKYTYELLKEHILADDFHHMGVLPNNFSKTLPANTQTLRAIGTFKDEYLLDYINVEELGCRDDVDIDERVLENAIIHNVKNFILAFGKDFAFVRNQYHLDAFGVDQYIDLLFFNRELNCLVAVELKKGPFKTAYLGQLSGYLSILDGFEKKPHENPSIGLILCKDMNKAFVDYVIRDYDKPMGVATYKTSKDMSTKLMNALPDIDELKKLLESDDE